MSSDPYKYFRTEARELIEALMRGVLTLEKGRGDSELVSRLLRHAHTLKGAARVVKQVRIAELSHSIEGLLVGLREDPNGVAAQRIGELLERIDGMSAELARLGDNPPEPAALPVVDGPRRGPGMTAVIDDRAESVRVGIKELDAFLRMISQLRVQLGNLSCHAEAFEQTLSAVAQDRWTTCRAQVPAFRPEQLADDGGRPIAEVHNRFRASIEGAHRCVEALHEHATALRLVQADALFPLLERTARDAAESTGRKVVLESSGGSVSLDAHGLGPLQKALVHVVRNAVTHGIESPRERAAAGKREEGTIRVVFERRADSVIVVCTDDGKGIDVARVREVALAQGLVTPQQAVQLTPADAAALLLRGGITTSRGVTQLAGRGIGLEVVRDALATLNGTVAVTSQPGEGTRIELAVPVMLWAQEVLHVQAGGALVSVPLRSVRQTVRLTRADPAQLPEGESIRFGGQSLRFLPLARLLEGSVSATEAFSAVILQSDTGIAALGVDHLAGIERVTIRPLPDVLGAVPLVRGALLDSEGLPQLVLDVDTLVDSIRSPGALGEAKPARRSPVLVIDDSLTTRMLEEGILQTAGYDVDTAASGEEALEMARRRRYGAFVVDVEMPGMDGFTFLQTARGEAPLSSVPAIMVTSRDTPEDRARGERLGVRTYIVKSAFDEQVLLNAIRELVG